MADAAAAAAPGASPPPAPAGAAPVKHSSPSTPVILNEASLDSPSFRANAIYVADQVDVIERWLEGYARTASKLSHDIMGLEETINNYLTRIIPPPSIISLDHDYTALALKRIGDGSREWWMQVLNTSRKIEAVSVEPIRNFLHGDLRNFKETKRVLEQTQKTFDQAMARYVGQHKTKEPSSLREDAFAVYETRKAYLRASMDFCYMAPQFRLNLDKLLVRVSFDIWREMKRSRDSAGTFAKYNSEMDRVRGWSKDMELTEATFKRELHLARRDIGEATLASFKPSREIDDYSISTVPFLGSRGPMNVAMQGKAAVSEKQGWLFLRTISGKPSRTNWIRRWYYCRDGIFGWLVNGPQGVLQGDEIGVLLCSAKPAVQEERRFCFEVKTKNQTLLLQAETQSQLMEWLEVFEVAKKKAFEASVGRDNSSLPGGIDPAFSITPPSLPEFSAKSLDAQLLEASEGDRPGNLPVPGTEGGPPRASFDVSSAPPKRSTTSLAREEGESGREHAARIMQKLDLHRKSAFTSGADLTAMPAPGPAGGIASLISASHGLLPGYAPPLLNQAPTPKLPPGPMQLGPEAQTGSLAPPTLANAPAATILSRTAVSYSGERAFTANPAQTMPTAIMANYWGSNAWGREYSARVSRTDVASDDPFGPNSPSIKMTLLGDNQEKSSSNTSLHKKAISMDAQIGRSKDNELSHPKPTQETFPPNYPTELKTNSAQFRLLFPSVSLDEKLVLVFRSSWNSTSGPERSMAPMAGNGRIYVTSDNMYFYGHQMGLVVAYAISLDTIAEVTAAPGKDCDFLFLHLSPDTDDTGYTRITIKTFLEDMDLLHARLNLLIDDLQAEEPMDLPELIRALVDLENEEFEKRSPSADSWEDVSANTPHDDGTPGGKAVNTRASDLAYKSRRAVARKPLANFQLPTHPVLYEPEDMQNKAAERNFEISAKACFHVLFGDKSFIFPKLYFERRAQQIAQGPWKTNEAGNMQRLFRFKVNYTNRLGRSRVEEITDNQVIDLFSDHVTYVVTYEKTPWHLPHSNGFKLVTKIVITHVAKSKCKLAIFTKVVWSKPPALGKNMVERQALDDASHDAEQLAEVTTDQVRRLGHHSRTKRAIQVYGNVGLQTQVVVFSPGETDGPKKAQINPRTLGSMIFETIRSFAESVASSLVMWALAALKKLWDVVAAQYLLLALLALSVLVNAVLTSQGSATWWAERRAVGFMNRVGVGPNVMMSKAVYLTDLDQAAKSSAAAELSSSWPRDSYCYTTFQSIANSTDMDAPHEDAGATLSSSWGPSSSSRATARRLRRTRQRLGSYRHDLLVAMRMVNSVEAEMLRAEWENWLLDEDHRCEQVGAALSLDRPEQRNGTSSSSTTGTTTKSDEVAQKVVDNVDAGQPEGEGKGSSSGSNSRREDLRRWHDDYCGSCRADAAALARQRQGESIGRW
ncbi:PH domain-containing protein [Xylariaceae sp. FL0804]|nr:PH domain-containing protein [Xylariaceae sp. FL0804]